MQSRDLKIERASNCRQRELKSICWFANYTFNEKDGAEKKKMTTGTASKTGIWMTI